ncbi:glycosyltransferase family 4 protein [Tianweitania sp. BSSL-BM11]|uniref:Glycosyltransferase family 4 protein n=1 Tax=Tianweitania aestuarii TaxID=2814886 RepID=A0ABS5RTR3_9HYPH|nr:glycosyltransferase family 4 protein [Tianweitania aestuarii]
MQPRFIFWGRLRTQKNVRRAIQLFEQIRLIDDQAHFAIIGPDGGEGTLIKECINSLGLQDHVTMHGPLDHEEITQIAASSHFYLQTSTHEGMAMSVVEAMQLGLIPVVTAVGEIANYCTDRINSLIIHDDAATVASIRDLLGNPNQARLISESAVDTWRNISFYRDDVVQRSRHILGSIS